MNKSIWLLPLLAVGCIEYQPASTLPPAGAQNERPLEAKSQTDKLVQTVPPEVDILWVIDNSGSMYDEQTALTANFPAFMDFFLGSGLDYHIGVVSTDMTADAGRLEVAGGYKWIDIENADPSTTFSTLANLGTSGSATEKGRDPAYAAVEINTVPGGFNEGFIRENASLHMISISDEDDQSNQISRAEFIDYLRNVKGGQEGMVSYSAIITPEYYAGTCTGGIEPGMEYLAVQQAIGGVLWPICNPDWNAVLEQLGIVAAGLKREFFLSQLPEPGSIKVWVVEDGTRFDFEEDVDYTYSQTRNSVTFTTYVPTALADVNIKYAILGSDSQ